MALEDRDGLSLGQREPHQRAGDVCSDSGSKASLPFSKEVSPAIVSHRRQHGYPRGIGKGSIAISEIEQAPTQDDGAGSGAELLPLPALDHQ